MNPRGTRLRGLVSMATLLSVVACGGTADPGLVVDPSVVAITVSPSTAQLLPSAPQTFVATVTGTTNTSVVWQVTETSTGGTIDAAGLYHAPSSPGTFHVVATSVADGTKSATATVTVTAAPAVVSVSVSPQTRSVTVGGTVQFTATVSGTSDTRATWSVTETSSGGAIDSAGLYHAPSSPGTFHVVATSVADGTKTATATVTVTAAPTAVSVSVSPQTKSVSTGGTVQFTATVSGSSDTRSTWSVTEGSSGGTVDATGLYQAPSSAGTFHVVATSAADGTKSATATVTVTTPPPPPVSLAAQFDVLSRHALFFDHASVGENLMDGVAGLLSSVSSAKPKLINMNVSNGGLRPDLIHTGIWAESMKLALLNGSPMEKVAMFKTDLASGVGAVVDIAFMKFCFVDFTSATDVDALFAAYQSMITSVKALYPGIHFVHVTAPLESPSNDAFNAKREAYSAKVRAAYGTDVFDLALFESTRPDGTRETVGGVPALVPAYTSDSGHLNATGQAKVVPELVKFLANLP
jgi:acyl-coenzyme A thioesterase PaaI-like protein